MEGYREIFYFILTTLYITITLQAETQTSLPLTKIIDSKSLEDAGGVSDEEGALVIGDGDDQGAAQADHEVRHGEAEEESVHGLEERRVPQHHDYDETIVKDRQHCVDEHEERENAVAQPGEDGGHHQVVRARAPRRAVALHGAALQVLPLETQL